MIITNDHFDDRGPTWYEGYWACVMGWSLHKDASKSYRLGYLAALRSLQTGDAK